MNSSSKNNKKCLLCHKDVTLQFKPFCSQRCQQVDLGRWLSGVYSVPTEEIDSDNEKEDHS